MKSSALAACIVLLLSLVSTLFSQSASSPADPASPERAVVPAYVASPGAADPWAGTGGTYELVIDRKNGSAHPALGRFENSRSITTTLSGNRFPARWSTASPYRAEVRKLSSAILSNQDEEEREAQLKELEGIVGKSIDESLEQQAGELKKLEERLAVLREAYEKRAKNRDRIVSNFVDNVRLKAEGMSFDAGGGSIFIPRSLPLLYNDNDLRPGLSLPVAVPAAPSAPARVAAPAASEPAASEPTVD